MKDQKKSSPNAVRIICLILAGLFVLSLIIVPLIYLLG